MVKKTMIYDGYNGYVRKDNIIGTLTHNCSGGLRQGWLLIEVYEHDKDQERNEDRIHPNP